MPKYSILTCIFGGYEFVREIINPDPDIEYIMVTDNKELKSETWTVLYYPYLSDFPEGPDRWAYIRYHPWEFVNTDICLYIDGSVQIKDNPINILKEFEESSWEYGALEHPIVNTIEAEVDRWAYYGYYGYSCEDAGRVHDYLNRIGYKDVYGLLQSTILIYKNTKLANTINSHTWTTMFLWGKFPNVDRINQTTLTYAVHKMAWQDDRFILLNPANMWSRCFDYCYHNSKDSQKEGFRPFINFDESYEVKSDWHPLFQNRYVSTWIWK